MRREETKYAVLLAWIKEKIQSGELENGQKLYSENELSRMFNLSRQTVRRAIGILEKDGLVERVRGSGTYIGGRIGRGRKRYMNIAVISTYVDSYIFPATLQGIVSTLNEAGYMAQVSFTNNRVADEQRILKNLLEKDTVDGVIVEAVKSALPNPNIPLYRELQKRHIPVLFFNCRYPELEAPVVSLDDTGVALDAVNYLLQNGHRKIAGIFKSDDGQGKRRYQGYVDALMAAGVELDDRKILWIDTEDQKNMKNIKASMLRRLTDCTAVLCYNDEVAFSVLDILEREGIRIPGQLSVISIDGAEQSITGQVHLTTIPYPTKELGAKAAANLLELLKNPMFDGNFLYRPKILEQDSVRTL